MADGIEPVQTPFLDSVIEGLNPGLFGVNEIRGNLTEVERAQVDAAEVYYDQRFLEPAWTQEDGKQLSVYGGMFQELAWIRRLLIRLNREQDHAKLTQWDMVNEAVQTVDSSIKTMTPMLNALARIQLIAIATNVTLLAALIAVLVLK
jgi:hypothetical protein